MQSHEQLFSFSERSPPRHEQRIINITESVENADVSVSGLMEQVRAPIVALANRLQQSQQQATHLQQSFARSEQTCSHLQEQLERVRQLAFRSGQQIESQARQLQVAAVPEHQLSVPEFAASAVELALREQKEDLPEVTVVHRIVYKKRNQNRHAANAPLVVPAAQRAARRLSVRDRKKKRVVIAFALRMARIEGVLHVSCRDAAAMLFENGQYVLRNQPKVRLLESGAAGAAPTTTVCHIMNAGAFNRWIQEAERKLKVDERTPRRAKMYPTHRDFKARMPILQQALKWMQEHEVQNPNGQAIQVLGPQQ